MPQRAHLSRPSKKIVSCNARSLSGSTRPRVLELLERREVLDASLQIIHNSPYAAAAEVDVYVNDELLLDNFAFRSATPYVTVPAGVDLKIDITAAAAPNNQNPVFTTIANLADDADYIAIASGDPLVSVGQTAFGLAVSAVGRQSAQVPGNAEFLVYHGAPDAPTVDVLARNVGTLVNDISFRDFSSDYLSVPPNSYTIDVTLDDGVTRIRSFTADLAGAAGGAIVIAASGFAAPAPGQPDFGLLAVLADGTTSLLPQEKPVITGTTGKDVFEVKLADNNAGILQVSRGSQTTQFLTLTNPQITIEGGKGNDRLNVHWSNSGPLPTIAFDGGAGYDTATIYGSGSDDSITLIEAASFASALPANAVAFRAVEAVTVWAGAGNDHVDATALRTINTWLNGQAGDDVLRGGKARDIIFGGLGNDLLEGNDGDDVLFGGLGKDKLNGGRGFDLLLDFLGHYAVDQFQAKHRATWDRY